ncbi:MAG: hypothetical protein M3N08_04840 [Pseudomonadota bacterium]|nr:hypothetical protein [Pseudomonadota bacterium]
MESDSKKSLLESGMGQIGAYAGVVGIVASAAAKFYLPLVLLPLGVLLAIIAILNRRVALGIGGLAVAGVVFLLSPSLLSTGGHGPLGFGSSGQTQVFSRLENQMREDQAKQEAVNQMNAGIAECREQRLLGKLKTYLDSAKCSGPLTLQAFRAVGYPYMDLIEKLNTQRLELAAKLDRGELTDDEAVSADDDLQNALHEQVLARQKATPAAPGP